MTTHLTKVWWDLNKHKLVEQAIPEAEIYKREWVGLTLDEIDAEWGLFMSGQGSGYIPDFVHAIEAKLKEKNT